MEGREVYKLLERVKKQIVLRSANEELKEEMEEMERAKCGEGETGIKEHRR